MRTGRGARDFEAAPVERWLDDTGAVSQRPSAWVVDLIGSAPPISVPVALKQRMLLSLGGGRHRRQGGWLRPLVAAGVLIGGSAIASAAFTDWPARVVRVCGELAAPAVSPDRRAPERQPSSALAVPVWKDEAMAVPVASAPSAVPRRRAPEASRPRAHVHAAGPEDPSLVVEATRALRVDRDARRARLLSARYLDQHPTGTLVEEALAIEIEAALDHHDQDVRAQAARYLSLYPHGAFRALAERVLASADLR